MADQRSAIFGSTKDKPTINPEIRSLSPKKATLPVLKSISFLPVNRLTFKLEPGKKAD